MERRTSRNITGRPRSARPYDRPNQSILGKVASKVKGLLNPSWLFNVTQWMGTSTEEEPGCSTELFDEEAQEEEFSSQILPRGSKRPRLNEPGPSILSRDTQTWLEPPSNLYDITSHVPPSASQSSLVENKEPSAIMNGDDHSENSEGSASTSGCSSLVSSHKGRLSCLTPSNSRFSERALGSLRGDDLKTMRNVSSSKGDINERRPSLWSSPFSSSPRIQRCTPTIAQSNQPNFNLSTFSGPSKLTPGNENKIASPFYKGKTTFGGASSSSRRMPTSAAPYQVDKSIRNQLRVREHHSDDSLEGMSSAAKRILLTLEKMSSPLADAKKIPNVNTSPVDLSLYLTPPKHRRNAPFTPCVPSKGPPIANINTLAKLTTLKNSGLRRLNTSMEIPVPVPDSNIKPFKDKILDFPNIISPKGSETSISSVPNLQPKNDKVMQKKDFPINYQQKSPSSANKFSLSSSSDATKGGGKMRVKINQLHHSSKDSNTTELPSLPDLTNIPLPISKLPIINFGPKKDKASDDNSQSGTGFTFSNPIEHIVPTPTSLPLLANSVPERYVSQSDKKELNTSKPFVFSKPIDVFSNSNLPNSEPSKVPNNMAKLLKSANSASDIPKSKEVQFSQSKPANTSNWECSYCWVRNPSSTEKCLACETTRISEKNSDAPVIDLTDDVIGDSIGAPPEAWECNICWVRNPIEKQRCLACETSRVTDTNSAAILNFAKKLSKHGKTWECSSCWVRNPITKEKCVACESPKMQFQNVAGDKSINSSQSASLLGFSGQVSNKDQTKASDEKIVQASSVPVSSDVGKRNEVFPVQTAMKEQVKDISGLKNNKLPVVIESSSGADGKFSAFAKASTELPTGTSTSSLTTTSTSTFTFGAPVSSAGGLFGAASFSFSAATCASSTTSSDTFTFGTAVTTNPLSKQAGMFKGVNETKSSMATSASNFNAVTTNPSTAFKLGSTTVTTAAAVSPTPTPSSTNAFVFETPKAEPQTTVSMPFMFDAGMKNSVNMNVSSSPIISTGFKSISTTSTSETKETPSNSLKIASGFNFPDTKQATESFSFGSSKENAFTFKIPNTTVSSIGGFSGLPATKEQVQINSSQDKTNPVFSLSASSKEQKLLSAEAKISQIFSVPAAKKEQTKPNTELKNNQISVTESFSSVSSFPKAASALNPGTAFNVPAPSTSAFTFGTTAPPSSTPGFSFFPSSSASTTTNSSERFSFGTAANSNQLSKPGGFAFKGLNEAKSVIPTSVNFNAPATNPSTAFKFGSFTPTTSAPTPALNPTPAPTSTSGFVFGAPKNEPQTAVSAPFAFGSGTASSGTSTFSGFQLSQPANPTFQFGQSPAANNSGAPAFGSTTSNFSFGTQNETPNQLTNQTAQPAALTFGSAPVQPAFGSASATTFSRPEQQQPGGFVFSVPAAPTAQVFRFGEKNQTPASGFAFGASTQGEAANSFPTGFSVNTPPSFNFGATSTPTVPFQFAASTDNSANQSSAPRKYRKAVRRVLRKQE